MCGVVGVHGAPDAARQARSALFAQQHRGQDGAGIATVHEGGVRLRRGLGLVKEIYDEASLEELPGGLAIGHVRYPTQGGVALRNTQPHHVELPGAPPIVLASNGDLVNYKSQRQALESSGARFSGENDGELLARFLAHALADGKDLPAAVLDLMHALRGAYSAVALVGERLVAFRDPWGIRPLWEGRGRGGERVFCSESVGLDILRAERVGEVPPGGMVAIGGDGIERHVLRGDEPSHHCVFELIYFARPDAEEFGELVYSFRKSLGAALARQDDGMQADVVFPIPDSSNVIALGYSEESGVPFGFGLTRNHYVGRTFIAPEQRTRDETVKEKFNLVPRFFSGRRVVLVDDSIVRGSTLRKLVGMVRGQGAREVHVRIGSPPVKHPCFYGIDTPTEEQLIASSMDERAVGDHLGADSLRYLGIDALRGVTARPGDFCMACFDNDYPLGRKEAIVPVAALTDGQ